MISRALLVAAAIALSFTACAHPPWNPYKNWEVARSKHVTLYSNTRTRYTVPLENIDLAYAAVHSTLFQKRAIAPVEVVLLEGPAFQELFGQFRGSATVAKLPGKGLLGRRGVVVLTGTEIPMGWAAHRLTHLFLHSIAPNAPLWLHEGLASYLETVQYLDDGKGKAVACLGHLRAKQPEIPIADLFGWSWRGYDESNKSSWYRYTAANLIDYFLSGESGALRDKFGQFLGEIADAANADVGAALAKVYPGMTVASLEQKAREHRRHSETSPRGVCPLPFQIPQDKAGDDKPPRIEAAEKADIEELMVRLQMLPRRGGYVDWYPPDVIGLAGGESGRAEVGR